MSEVVGQPWAPRKHVEHFAHWLRGTMPVEHSVLLSLRLRIYVCVLSMQFAWMNMFCFLPPERKRHESGRINECVPTLHRKLPLAAAPFRKIFVHCLQHRPSACLKCLAFEQDDLISRFSIRLSTV